MAHDPGGRPVTDRVRIPDGDIHVRILGRGTPVLYLHGVSARGATWLPVAERVAHRARAWLPDLLSRGESASRPDLSYDLDSEVVRAGQIADALARAELGVGAASPSPAPRVLVGHSHGAAIAIAVAATRPGVEALLLSNPVSPWIGRPRVLGALESRAVRRAVARALAPLHRPFGRLVLDRAGGPHHRPTDEEVRLYAAPYADPGRAEALLRVLADWRPAELEGRLPPDPPTVRVVAGAFDPRIPVSSARRLAAALGAPLRVIEDGGHILPGQHPAALAEELALLLDGLEGGG